MFSFDKILQALLTASAIVVSAGSAVAAPEVTWEVENRFRFYQTPEPFKAYLKVAKDTRATGLDDWILHTERELQQKHLNEAHPVKERPNGWASLSMDSTCWDRGGFVLIEKDRCEDYTLPGSHRVLLSVAGVDQATARCSVEIKVIASQTPKQFNQKRRTELFNKRSKEIKSQQKNVDCRDIPVEVPFSTTGDAGVEATVTLTQSGAPTDLPPVRIVVNDLLVLGMGDSFGAGVGNPDRPSQISANSGIIYDDETTILPVRQNGFNGASLKEIGGAQAKWLDIRCFRSQYGPQFRAALHLAVDMPHSAVTFLDFACDGARIIEGLLHQKELDAGYDPDKIDPEAQLGLASRLLCASKGTQVVNYGFKLTDDASKCGPQKPKLICEYKPKKFRREVVNQTSMTVCGRTGVDAFRRKIDVLLLSIGGNDIGFAPMVGNILLGDVEFSDRLLRYLATEVGQIHPAAIGKTRLGFLHGKYQVLDQAIDKYLPLRQGSSKPVFLTAYPLPADDRQGELCGSSNASAAAARDALDSNSAFDGFTNPPSDAFKRLKEVVNTSCLLNIRRIGWFNGGADADSVLQQLTEAGKPCAGLAANAETGLQKIDWQFEFALLQKWHGHGFCAVKSGEQASSALSIPKANSLNVFTPSLEKARSYDSRQRWVRTPNDAFMITNWQTFSPRLGDSVNLLTATTTSAMHPTAEGYASMADSLRGRVAKYVCAERAGEFGGEPLCTP